MGIVGLPNVGKSTLFNALTKKAVPAENYPFCTIDPSVGVVAVPDERLSQLSRFSKSVKTIPAAMEFVDIAGLVKGAAEGEGLGNKFLSHIREVDAIAQVVRVFRNDNIVHVHNKIDPLNDIEIIETELVLADLETVTKRADKLKREVKMQDKEAIKQMNVIEKVRATLENGKPARDAFAGGPTRESKLEDVEAELVKDLHLLTMKPVLYIYNTSNSSEIPEELKVKKYVVLDIKLEEELSGMTKEEMKELEVESGLDNLIKESYSLLGLMNYFTTGPEETRAWIIKNGSTAPEAGTAIHTDFKEKFIRADVINWQDMLNAGSYAAAREKGLLRTEGKEYVVKDGDVIEFRI